MSERNAMVHMQVRRENEDDVGTYMHHFWIPLPVRAIE